MGINNNKTSKTSNMDHLPQEVINIIISFANPRLTDKLKIHIEIVGKIQSEMYEDESPKLKYTYKNKDGSFRYERLYTFSHRWVHAFEKVVFRDFHPPNDDKYYTNCGARKPFRYDVIYDTRKELIEMLTNYYGGNKIPLISKLKTKKHIVQRIMSL